VQYFFLILKHKWFVFRAGVKLGVPILQLILHDLSKFLPCELPHYQRRFFGKADDPRGFTKCWLHHQNHNKHHWEYWISRTNPRNQPVEMPTKYIKEMMADWMGAGKAYEGKWPDPNNWTWLEKNIDKMVLHEVTRKWIDQEVERLKQNIK
jgi:hypothetical protein